MLGAKFLTVQLFEQNSSLAWWSETDRLNRSNSVSLKSTPTQWFPVMSYIALRREKTNQWWVLKGKNHRKASCTSIQLIATAPTTLKLKSRTSFFRSRRRNLFLLIYGDTETIISLRAEKYKINLKDFEVFTHVQENNRSQQIFEQIQSSTGLTRISLNEE